MNAQRQTSTNVRERPFEDYFAIPLRNGLTKPRRVRGAGTKMVNMGELFARDRIHEVRMDRVPMSEKETALALLEMGDLLFARQSLVREGAGKCSIFLGDSEDVTFESHIIRARLDPTTADPLFFYYYFESPQGRLIMDTIVEQVAAAGIRGSDLAKLPVPCLPLDRQTRIAHILGTLDDKIELNRRMNQTLEAIARAIFKSWFIDFDPVIDNAILNGKPIPDEFAERAAVRREILARSNRGLDVAGYRQLFPDSFQDSLLGKIPEGWEINKLDRLLRLARESVNPQEHPAEKFYHYSIPAYDSGNPASELGKSIRSTKYLVPPSGVLISKLNPHIPRIWLPRVSKARRAVCSTEFLVCVPSEGASREYLYCLLSSAAFLDEFAQMVTGTTGSHQRVRPAAFIKMKVVVPPRELLAAFKEIAEPLFSSCAAQISESSNLAMIRDALIPRILSGTMEAASND